MDSVFDPHIDRVFKMPDVEKLARMLHPQRSYEISKALGTEARMVAPCLKEIRASKVDLYDFVSWGMTETMQDFARGITAMGGDMGAVTTIAHQVFFQATQRLAGSHVYSVSRELALRLKDTKLRTLKPEHLVMPAPALYVQIPSESGLRVFNVETGWHEIEGVYVAETKVAADDKQRVLRLMVIGKPKEGGRGLTDDALLHFKMLMGFETLEDCVLETIKAAEFGPKHPEWSKEIDDEIPVVFQFVVNVLLYIQATNVDVEKTYIDPQRRRLDDRMVKCASPAKRKKIAEQLRATTPGFVWKLGTRLEGTWDPKAEGFKIELMVTGHWKHVPHGPNRELRRLQWIEPYQRGQWVKGESDGKGLENDSGG